MPDTLLTPRRARPVGARRPDTGITLPWVQRVAGSPYFMLEDGEPWAPIGANEAISWPELAGLFRARDLPGVEAHLAALRAQGVTVLRLMLEYAQGNHRFFERPAGRVVPAMVRLWDDLFAICERVGMRILLTPYDTFFQWTRWHHHPYNQANGGPCADRRQLIVCPDTRVLVKGRLAFVAERWGGSGALFAWDLWNELHPAQGNYDFPGMWAFVSEMSDCVRELETRLHGRSHLQTVSVFGPELLASPQLNELIFRHPSLDFASTHFYAKGTIDAPRDTVAPAAAAGLLVRDALAEIRDDRPFFESEHGPIHGFKDKHRTLPEAFDDEYFRHIQWAHLASGAAGGGMRWPNRHPHVLTPGMRRAQRALSAFLPLVDWARFRRRNLNAEVVLRDAGGASLPLVVPHETTPAGSPPVVQLGGRAAAAFACGDERQAVAYLLRADRLDGERRVSRDAPPLVVTLELPGLAAGGYTVTEFDPGAGAIRRARSCAHAGGTLAIDDVRLAHDVAIAVVRE
jgi:hypothetical protein